MKVSVQFKNPKTGELKAVKVGWSWPLFLFSGILGIPLFLKGLKMWGGIMLALWIIVNVGSSIMPAAEGDIVSMFIGFIVLGLLIYFGSKGNEITAKNYLEKGWEFVDPESDIVKMAKNKWGLSL